MSVPGLWPGFTALYYDKGLIVVIISPNFVHI